MKIVRSISHIIIHSTGTIPVASMEILKKQWQELSPYHYVIKADGDIKKLMDENKSISDDSSNTVCGIHIAYIGGADKSGKKKDTRTRAQEDALFDLIVRLNEKYSSARAIGFDELTGQAENSPGFNVKAWLANYQPDFQSAA